jgi:carbon-monoxide dehydrogenase large subunit
MYASGTAIVEGAGKVYRSDGKQIAGFVLEARRRHRVFGWRFTIAGTDRSIGIMELAEKLRSGLKLPKGVPNSLSVRHVANEPIPSVFSERLSRRRVEVDPDTGVVEIVKYNSVNDFGTIINPLLVEGQVHGGVVQGIGQAIDGEDRLRRGRPLLTGSYMDYAMPRASDSPEVGFESHPVPAKNNPLGVKGCGEAGCAGALTSVMNAIVDALSDYGVADIEMPATPERVWKTIQEAKAQHTM